MAALRKQTAFGRRLKEIEREKAELRARIEEVRRWADDLPSVDPGRPEPRLREAAIPCGYHRSEGAAASWPGVQEGIGVLERESDDVPEGETSLDFTPGPDGLDTKRVVMPRLQRTDLLRPSIGGSVAAPRLAVPEHDRFRNYFGTAGLKRVREARRDPGSQRLRTFFMLAMVATLGFILFKMIT